MSIAVFTSNQPRHLALVEALAEQTDEVFVVQGANTLFPGDEPGFYRNSDVMKNYFRRVMAAERQIFGRPRFSPPNVRILSIRSRDVNKLELDVFGPVFEAELIVVFGATWIRPPLIDHLVAHKAVNIHMGLSPWYRGSSSNFWAMFDKRPDLVGATIHMLSSGLDNGPILTHALPSVECTDPFVLGMEAVKSAHMALASGVADRSLFDEPAVPQQAADEIRYTRAVDFDDTVAAEYLDRLPSGEDLLDALGRRALNQFIRPFVLP